MSSNDQCLIVAEIAQAHDGSLGTAHAYIDAVANANADAIKFQTHIAAAESSLAEPWRVKFSRQDETRFDYWKRMEFSEDQWAGLRKHAGERGLKFLSSPFSLEAVQLLHRVGVDAWKIASGEFNNLQLIDAVTATGLPVYLSTGMSHLSEIDGMVDLIMERGNNLTLLQCTSAYPCPPEKVGLNMIPFFRKRYGCRVGLSDHSGTIYAGLAAAMTGISVLEVHVTFSRECFGPDVPASVTTSELRQLVEGFRFIERAANNPVEKDLIAGEMETVRSIFSRSLAARRELPAGTVLCETDVILKKPGTGIPADQFGSMMGRVLKRAVAKDEFLCVSDFEPHSRQLAS
jgi:N,N'-diacetyllegionaminate synthase